MKGLRGLMLLGMVILLFSLQAGGEEPKGPLLMVLRNQATGEIYGCMDVKEGEEVVLEFTHSYERFPVLEQYRVEGPKRIRLVRILSRSMLNGQGFWPGRFGLRGDGWAEIEGGETHLERIEFIMGSSDLADHRLILRQRVLPLSGRVPPGTQVGLEVKEGGCERP